MAFTSAGSPSTQSPAKSRYGRLTAPMRNDIPRTWNGGEVAPDRVGLYRRLTLGAAKRGWRLQPEDVEMLLDIYVAYVRRVAEPSAEACLRTYGQLQRRRR